MLCFIFTKPAHLYKTILILLLLLLLRIIIILYILIDVAIPVDSNVVQKEARKKLKYRSLCMEVPRKWNLKCTIIPGISGATGMATNGLKKVLKATPGKHSINSTQNTAVLVTSHIIRKVLQSETEV